MAIFNSYVKLPEGNHGNTWKLGLPKITGLMICSPFNSLQLSLGLYKLLLGVDQQRAPKTSHAYPSHNLRKWTIKSGTLPEKKEFNHSLCGFNQRKSDPKCRWHMATMPTDRVISADVSPVTRNSAHPYWQRPQKAGEFQNQQHIMWDKLPLPKWHELTY